MAWLELQQQKACPFVCLLFWWKDGLPDPVGESLRQVRTVHRNGQGEDGTALRQVVAGLPPALSQAIRAGDAALIQREAMPAVQIDLTLGAWLSEPGVDDWLTSYLKCLRVELSGGPDVPPAIVSSVNTHQIDDDIIV